MVKVSVLVAVIMKTVIYKKKHFVKVKKENRKVVVVMKSVITNLEKWKIIELFRKAKISVPSGSRNKKCN